MTDVSVVLDEREQSSMSSTWNEILVLKRTADSEFYLAICQQEVLGSLYDLPEEEQYDENGETVCPAMFDGKPVVGLGDGEWLLGAGLEETDVSTTFDLESLSVVDAFLLEHGWSSAGGKDESVRAAVEAALKGA